MMAKSALPSSTKSKKRTPLFINTAWKLRRFADKAQEKKVYLSNRFKLADDKFTLDFFEGIAERLGLFIEGDLDEGFCLVDRGFPFVPFWIDKLSWDFEEKRRNIDLVSRLIAPECPVSIIDVFYRLIKEEQTDVSVYVDERVEEAKRFGRHTSLFENDLRAVVTHINTKERHHIRCGVYSPFQVVAEDLKEELDRVALTSSEAAFLVFGILNGFWNRLTWEGLEKEVLGGERSLIDALTPFSILRETSTLRQKGVLIVDGHAGSAYFAAIDIQGLGVNLQDPALLNTGSWLRAFLPYEVEKPGDVVILATTFYAPEEPSGGKKSLLDLEEKQIYNLTVKEAREDEAEEDGRELNLLNLEQRNFLDGFRLGRKLILALKDERLVKVSHKILVQSPDKVRTMRLAEGIYHRLGDSFVLRENAASRDRQLKALRTALPIITEDDVSQDTAPFPLKVVTASIVPYETATLPEKHLKVLVGKTLPLGKPYYWLFGKSACILAGQGSGKTVVLIILCVRLDGMLEQDSVMWIYNGKQVEEEVAAAFPDISWPGLVRHLNREMRKDRLPSHLQDGLVYGSWYQSADELKKDLLSLRDNRARIIVFNALEDHHQRFQIEFGFFDAFFEHIRNRIPGFIGVDEIARLGSDDRAKRLFENAIEISEASQWLIWTGQTSKYLPDREPWKVRTQAQANTKVTCVGTTSLIASLAEEANIDVTLFADRARVLEETVAEFTVQEEPGVFVASEAGGKIMEAFKAVIEDEEADDLIQRKSRKDRERYGA